MNLHQNEANRFIHVYADKEDEQRCVEHFIIQKQYRQDQHVHKYNFHDCTCHGISCRTVSIVLYPVHQTDYRDTAEDQKKPAADFKGFSAQAHQPENRQLHQLQDTGKYQHGAAGKIHDALCSRPGDLMLSRTHSFAHQNGRGVGEAGKEADKQAFNGSEHRDRRDGRL